MRLYIAFIDLTKAFDLVSREGLFKFLPKIGCPQKLQSLFESFQNNMKWTVQYDQRTSEPFDINSCVKQGCVLALTLFGIFFASSLKHTFETTTKLIYLYTRSDGRLFNLACLKSKTNVRETLIRDMLLTDNVAVATHLQDKLQTDESHDGLNISLKKTSFLGQNVDVPPVITTDIHLYVI